MDIHTSFHPYRRFVFVHTLIVFVVMTAAVSAALYFVRTTKLFRETQDTLQSIAVSVAANVPVDVHEQLTSPEQQTSSAYVQIEKYFQSVMDGNPKIDDIYTLRPTSTPHLMTFVVSGKETADQNGNGAIDDAELKANLGEEYDTADFPQLEEGLRQPSADDEITYDKWGAWLSGYAPVKNAEGVSVAVLGVDLSSSFINAQRNDVLGALALVDLAALPVFVLISWWFAQRMSRPFRILGQGMYNVSHGDSHHQLALKGRGADHAFIELFNGMVQMIGSAKHHEDDEK